MRLALAYIITAAVMAGLDAVWLGTLTKAVYQPAIGALLADRTNIPAAILFYILYVAGIVLFAVAPALRAQSWLTALALGAAAGFFAYMTYDLTNLATLKVWPSWLAAMDIAWGTLVTGIAATAGYAAVARFG